MAKKDSYSFGVFTEKINKLVQDLTGFQIPYGLNK